LRLLRDDTLAARVAGRALRVIEEYYQPEEQLQRIERALAGQSVEEPGRATHDRRSVPAGAAFEVIT
jgi:hypothetical protein